MPPTFGAFLQHVRRSHVMKKTLFLLGSDSLSRIKNMSLLFLKTLIAPVELLNPESCGCNTMCSTGHCTCRKKPAEPCSQFGGCNEKCENTDPAPEEIIVCSGKCATVRCYCRSEGLSSNYKWCCKECTNNKPHSEETDSEYEAVLTKELEINILRSTWCI